MNSSAAGRVTVQEMAFWLLSFFLLFYALGFRSLWGSEDRWAEVTREMLLFRDFFHPQINGQPYFDKPLFTYWAIIPATWITGSLNELSVRLPSAVSGLVTLLGTIQIGRRLSGKVTGLLAGGLLLVSWGFLFWSRTAAADAENMAVTVLAVWWYFIFRDRPGFLAYLGFYTICALGAHFKGLTAVAVPAVVLLPDVLRQNRWKEYVSLSNAAALAIGLCLYLLPFIYAGLTAKGYGESGIALAFRENVLRFFNAFDHREPFYCYLYYVPFLFLPWALLLPAAVYDRIRGLRQLDEKSKWISMAVLAVFLLFTLSSSRRSYYILPILPFLSLFTADFLLRPSDIRIRNLALSSQTALLFLAGLTEISSPLLWPAIKTWTEFPAPASLKIASAASGALILLALGLKRLSFFKKTPAGPVPSRLVSLFLASFFLMGGFFCFQQNSLEIYRTRKPFILGLKRMIPDIPPERIGLSKNMAGVVFYLGMPRPVRDIEKPDALEKFLALPGQKVIIARKKDAKKILPLLAKGSYRVLVSAPKFSWSRRNDKGLIAWELF